MKVQASAGAIPCINVGRHRERQSALIDALQDASAELALGSTGSVGICTTSCERVVEFRLNASRHDEPLHCGQAAASFFGQHFGKNAVSRVRLDRLHLRFRANKIAACMIGRIENALNQERSRSQWIFFGRSLR
jgi:hypothetical protein